MDCRALGASSAAFGLRLADSLGRTNPGANVFVSPLSVMLALGMTANGAKTSTLEGIVKALQLPDNIDSARESLSAAISSILSFAQGEAGQGVELSLANSLWANKKVEFDPSFISSCKEGYQAEVAAVDFDDATSVAKVNDWVSQKTGGKIPKILDKFSPMDVLVLLNAIFFKGTWAKQFPAEATTKHPFTLANGDQRPHPLMRLKSKFRYSKNTDEGYEAIRLPYIGDRISMYVILPAQGSNPGDLLTAVGAQGLGSLLGSLREQQGTVALPRFKLEYGADLNSVLKGLGMEEAFSATDADFSGMLSPPNRGCYISLVRHKAFVEVNEEGTTAAAATAVMMTMRDLPVGPQPFEMIVDRPFLCAIMDDTSGALLFLGSIFDPGTS